jgi:hypothetical protein
LLDEELFADWMKWRWYNYKDTRTIGGTCGMSYQEGWKVWKDRPVAQNDEFTVFLDEVHQNPLVDSDVETIVRQHRLVWWRRLLAV